MGRLIDADKTIECMQYYHDDCAKTSEYTRLGFETAIEVVKDAPTIEAIPKDQYKADMVAMLEELRLEFEEYEPKWVENEDQAIASNRTWDDFDDVIQQKIKKLKES